MQIENLKRWHWIVIGALVGLIFGAIYAGSERPEQNVRTTTVANFEGNLRQDPRGDYPPVRNIKVYPAKHHTKSDGSPITLSRVEYDLLTRDSRDRDTFQYIRWAFFVQEPYELSRRAAADLGLNEGDTLAFRDYLQRLGEKYEHIDVSYNWWNEPKWVYALSVAAGVVVIGGIWPTVINLLVGAGFGRPPTREKGYDLRKASSKTPAPAAPQGPTSEEEQQLRDLEASLEASLRAGAQPAAEAAPETAPAEQPIRKLDAGPAEPAPAPPPREDDEPREYKGEFYPVARSGKKHDE